MCSGGDRIAHLRERGCKEGVMRVGYSQTGPWFYKDAKTGDLGGIYKDAVDRLAT